MKKLSLRMRLTLVTTALITAIAVILALLSMYNAGYFFVSAAQAFRVDETLNEETFSATDDATVMNEDGDVFEVQEVVPGFGAVGMISEDTGVEGAEAGVAGLSEASFTVPASVGTTISFATSAFNELNVIYTIIVIAAGAVATWFVLGRALRPVKRLSEEIAGISENELDVRITEFQAGDEINKLADSFNLMIARLQHAFENQKSFSTAAAHELKTPLATIKARLDVTEMDGNPTKQEYAKAMEVVRNQTERMIGIVDDLFLFSNTNEYEYSDEVVLEELLGTIVEQLGRQVEEKGLTVKVEAGGHTLRANRSMLERAFMNIIENAAKYNKENGKITIRAQEKDGGYEVSVKDTGIGIPEGMEEQIFQPFFRIDGSRSRKTAGAGLGLAIAKKMIEQHGGGIAVTQNEEGGSTFTVMLYKSGPSAVHPLG